MNIKTFISYIKKNTVTVGLVVALVVVLVITALLWWLKIKDFKISDLILKLKIANAQNEISYLKTKKAVIVEKKNHTKSEIEEVEEEIKEEHKKVERNKMKIEGLSDDEIVRRFNELGF